MSCAHNINGYCVKDKTHCRMEHRTICAQYIEADLSVRHRCTHVRDENICCLDDSLCTTNSPECKHYRPYVYKKKEPIKYCKYCFNARIYKPTDEELMDPSATELTDENDFSSCSVGHCHSKERRFMINSGDGRPVNIEFELLDNRTKEWYIVGRYYPKYCPECGRRLDEYDQM